MHDSKNPRQLAGI